MARRSRALVALVTAAAAAACAGDRPATLAAPEAAGAVQIRYDLRARPFAEVPLPSDLATRLDETSPTGRFVNISREAPTFLERDTRDKANRLSGFGVYMPITVPLDDGRDGDEALIDLDNIVERHWRNDAFDDDVALLINVDRDSPGFGELVPLDFGQGNFPLVLEKRDNYFDNDPRADGTNLLFESVDEDLDGDGVLDPGEDTNGDGVLGRPNVFPGMAAARADDPGFVPGVDDLVTFYEYASKTLIFRPILPLRQRTRYAVVLTRHLLGADGRPVRAPFDGIHPALHGPALEPLAEVIEPAGFGLEDVVYAWSYTTQDVTGDLEAIREGLYGSGPFARLAAEFPPTGLRLLDARADGEGRSFLLPLAQLGPIFQTLLGALFQGPENAQKTFSDDIGHIDYFVQGVLPGPNFLADKDGQATARYPADDDESFAIDPRTGEAQYGTTDITFWCAVPKAGGGKAQPFDVAVYSHSYTISRFELFIYMGRLARFGIAGCAIDAYGHGNTLPTDPIDLRPLVDADTQGEALLQLFSGETPLYDGPSYGAFVENLEAGRARDLNNDGVIDTGGDFWTHDLFHTRDIVRQSMVDLMQIYRTLRAFDGATRIDATVDGATESIVAGDFDGDGTVDLGGPDARMFLFGGSMGGILSAVLGALEPTLDAVVPVVGGAGLLDIGARSRQGGVPEAVLMPIFGPMILVEPVPDEAGKTQLVFQVSDVNRRGRVVFHETDQIAPGDRVVLINEANGERESLVVPLDGRTRLSVAADALTATEKRPVLGMREDNSNVPVTVKAPELLGDPLTIVVHDGHDGPVKATIDSWNVEGLWQGARYLPGARLTAIAKGLGKKRQTPDFRRFRNLGAAVLEAADPAAHARHLALEPLDFAYDPRVQAGLDEPGVNVLFMPTVGDMNVPVATGIANARCAGLIELHEPDERWGKSENDVLIDNWIIEGTEATNRWLLDDGDGAPRSVLFDADDLNQGSPDFGEPNLDPPLRLTKTIGPAGNTLALRMPYVFPTGTHGFAETLGVEDGFDMLTFPGSQIGWFFETGGTEVRDDACMETSDCDFLPERVRVGLQDED